MNGMTLEYWNELARQLILISSLLSGFSIAITANLLVYKSNNGITNSILKAATIAAGCFLVSVFSMTKILMMTTKGFPFEIADSDWVFPGFIGSIAFFLGVVSLTLVISLAGWTKSKSTGIFTTIVGALTLLGALTMLVN